MPFREELWNSELFATARELAGLRRGEGEGQTEFSSPRPVWHSSQRGRGDKCEPISYRMGRLISSLYQMKDDTVIRQAGVGLGVSAATRKHKMRGIRA